MGVFFDIYHHGKRIPDVVACKECKKVYTFKVADGVHSLIRHKCFAKAREGTSNIVDAIRKSNDKVKPRITEEDKKKLNVEIVQMSAIDLRPLSFATGEGFKKVANTLIELGSKYGKGLTVDDILLDPTRYSRKILPDLYDEVISKLKKSLLRQFDTTPTHLPAVTFTGDHWTSKHTSEEYTSISASWLDEDFSMHNNTLCVDKYTQDTKHSASILLDIEEKLRKIVPAEVINGRESLCTFVSDSDSKLVAAIRPVFTRVSCSAHDLSLCVKTALKRQSSISDLIEGAKTIVQHFKRVKYDESMIKTKLVQSVETRFNSTYHMLESIIKNWDGIVSILCERNELPYLSAISKINVELLCKILSPFDQATLMLAKSNTPTLHLVLPIYKSLLEKLYKYKCRESMPEIMRDLCSSLMEELEKKCLSKLTHYHFLATFLHPGEQFRTFSIMKEFEKHNTLARCKDLIKKCCSSAELHSPGLDRPKKKQKLLNSDSDEEDLKGRPVEISISKKCEVALYNKVNLENDEDSDDLCKVWIKLKSQFPKMYVIARCVLGIPATQNKSERDFSSAGLTITDNRANLNPQHVNELLVIRDALKKA